MPLAGRLGLFVLKLAVLMPLLYWVWGPVQPAYSAAVTAVADFMVGVEEAGERVTHLTPAGEVIHFYSALRTDGEPADSYNAEILHFYIVPSLAVVLALPGLAWRRRLISLAVVLGLVALFHAAALVVTAEYTYAVTLVKIAERNYTPFEASAYSWLREAFVFLAVQAVPAAVLVFLVASSGLLSGLAGEATAADRSPTGTRRLSLWLRTRRGRIVAGSVAAVVALPVLYGGCRHREKVHWRQSEKICYEGYQVLQNAESGKALVMFDRAVALKPSFADAHAGRGHALLALGNPAVAAEAFAEATRLNPSEPSWIDGRARALASSGRGPEAEALLVRSISAWPDQHYLRFTLVRVMAATGRLCQARPHLEEYLRRVPAGAQADRAGLILREVEARCPGS